MTSEVVARVITRDLNNLKKEIESYRDESVIWKTERNIANSAGNLCLHLIGNLNTYIGAILGNTGYVRDRDAEFALKNISRKELLDKLDATIKVINDVLPSVTEKQLLENYPIVVLKEATTTEYFLIHLAAHFSYHLGQINYHRRLLD